MNAVNRGPDVYPNTLRLGEPKWRLDTMARNGHTKRPGFRRLALALALRGLGALSEACAPLIGASAAETDASFFKL
jgi:hypothetical protein